MDKYPNTYKVTWVSKIQSTFFRRLCLVATFPFLWVATLLLSLVSAFIYLAYQVALGSFILIDSFTLRWIIPLENK